MNGKHDVLLLHCGHIGQNPHEAVLVGIGNTPQHAEERRLDQLWATGSGSWVIAPNAIGNWWWRYWSIVNVHLLVVHRFAVGEDVRNQSSVQVRCRADILMIQGRKFRFWL